MRQSEKKTKVSLRITDKSNNSFYHSQRELVHSRERIDIKYYQSSLSTAFRTFS